MPNVQQQKNDYTNCGLFTQCSAVQKKKTELHMKSRRHQGKGEIWNSGTDSYSDTNQNYGCLYFETAKDTSKLSGAAGVVN